MYIINLLKISVCQYNDHLSMKIPELLLGWWWCWPWILLVYEWEPVNWTY